MGGLWHCFTHVTHTFSPWKTVIQVFWEPSHASIIRSTGHVIRISRLRLAFGQCKHAAPWLLWCIFWEARCFWCMLRFFGDIWSKKINEQSHVTSRRWTLLTSQSWWGRTEILMPSSDHPKSRCRHFFGLKSSTSGPWTFTQFFVGIRYFCVYIFCIFFLSLFCSTNIFVVLGALDFYTHLAVRSGYYFLDIASSHWQWVRLIGTPEWLEMILLVKIGTSQHHGSCRVRFTLPKAPLSNYIPLHPITSHYRMVIYHCCSHCHY